MTILLLAKKGNLKKRSGGKFYNLRYDFCPNMEAFKPLNLYIYFSFLSFSAVTEKKQILNIVLNIIGKKKMIEINFPNFFLLK